MKNSKITFLSTTFLVLIVLATFGFVRINQITNVEKLKIMECETKAILKDYIVRNSQEVIENGSLVIDTETEVNNKEGAPTLTFSPYAGQIKVGSNVRVTATDPDKIKEVKYCWDYPSGTVTSRHWDSNKMVTEAKCDFAVPSTTGVHVLRVSAVDSKGNESNNIFVPFYVVNSTPVTDTTKPEKDSSRCYLYPNKNESDVYTLYFTDTLTIAGKDAESGIYAIGYAWDNDSNYKTYINPTDSQIVVSDVPQTIGTHRLYYCLWNSQRVDGEYMKRAYYIDYHVKDNIAPKLNKILDQSILEITVGQALPSDEAIKAKLDYSDNIDAKNDITVTIDKSEINPNKAGKYENKLKIRLTDKSNNSKTYNVDFNVKTKPYDIPVTEINESKVYNGYNQYITDFSLAAGTGAKTITYKQNGTAVTPKNAGTYDVYLSAKAGDVYSAIAETKIGKFIITKANPTISLTFDENVEGGKINYSPNKTAKLNASVLLGENPTLTYSSSNPNVATISSNGTITLKGKGQTIFTVSAAETANFKAASKTLTLTVNDNTKPVITLLGNSNITLEVYTGTYTEAGATAIDDIDGNISNQIQITNNVNINQVGTYKVIYNVQDSAGNSADSVERTVVVRDTTKPVITDDPNNVYEMEVHGTKPSFAATATDNYDDHVTVSVTDNINVNKVGTYQVTFTSKDASNNTTQLVKPFEVKDTTKPVITIDNNNVYSMEVHGTIPTFNATATDNYDASVDVVVTNDINKDVVGNYTVTFTATDANNNTQTATKAFTVVDTTKPVITLDDNNVYSMEVHGTKPSFNATATDNYDSNVTVQVTDNINVDLVGTYKVTFTATDANGNTQVVEKEFSVVDTTKPVITIDENNVYSMEVHGTIPSFAATATDNYDGSVNVVITNDINKDVTGTYTVTFTATDAHNNKQVETKSFEVKDTTKPVITIDDNNVYTMEVHGTKPEFAATAIDNYDANVTVVVTDDINIDVVGEYTITFTATDAHNNTQTETKSFNVVDTTKPVITLNGDAEITLEAGQDTYTELGATATDNYDTTVTVTPSGTVDTTTVGDYTISYNAQDSNGNAAITVTRTIHVVDTTKPVITLNGDATITLNVGEDPYTELGATAEDPYFGTIDPDDIVISGSVNTAVVGDYTISYNVVDSHNVAADTVTRTVKVVDVRKPVITIDDNNVYSIEVHGTKPEFNATALDNYDGTINVAITDDINVDVVGTYTVTFTATDANNNKQVETKSFEVKDTTKPVITVDDTNNTYEMEVHGTKPEFSASATDNYDANVTVVVTDDIDVDVVGEYTITFTATDANNNTQTETRTFEVKDTTKPVISLVGDAEITLEVLEDTYTEQGATATDNYDETVTVITTGSVDTNVVGDYTISYNAQDIHGNIADTVTRLVHVVDTTKPVISLDTNNVYTMEVHGTKPVFAATALDSYDGSVNVAITDNINVDVVGTYKVTFKAKDANNNEKVVEKEFTVVDTTKPVITLTGASEITLEAKADTYTELGATATDNYDTEVTVVISGSVNTEVIGDYTISYNATDANGNVADTVTRTIHVKDTTIPVISLLGNAEVIIEVNTLDEYVDAGATASDNYDGDISSSIVKSGSVDVHEKGTYYINYNVKDSSNNEAVQVTRTVKVLDTTEPLITLDEGNVYSMEVHGTIPSLTATAYDLYDGNVAVVVNTDDIDVDVVDTYTVVFTATDTTGNVSTVEKEFTVVDTTKPEITLDTNNVYSMEVHGTKPEFNATATDNYDANVTVQVTDNINVDVVGPYTVTFTATDAHENTEVVEKEFEVKDTTKPVITIDENNVYEMEVHGEKPEFNATATDNYDANVTVEITDNIDVDVVGTYTVTFTSTDANNNTQTETRTFEVKDTTKPVISLVGNAEITLEVLEDEYTEQGATATDNYDGNITDDIVITGLVNTNVVGDYTIRYNVTDANNNAAVEVTRLVHVVDTTKPVIAIDNNNVYTMEVHGTKPTFAATALDSYDGSVNVVITDDIDVDVVGTYKVTFKAKDANNNEKVVEKEFTVVDTTKPVITLTGDAVITLEVLRDEYTELGATASDNYDTTVAVAITGTVDTTTVGTYTISYNAQDANGNIADTVTRTVKVVDTTKPTITILGDNPVIIEVNTLDEYVDAGATASDNYDGDISSSIVKSGSVDVHEIGTYYIKYNVKDANNNVATEVTRTVEVLDSTEPLITLDSANVYSMEVHGSIPSLLATAYDLYDGNVAVDVNTDDIDVDVVDTYTVAFTATDTTGNVSTVEKEFTVVDTTKPEITLDTNNVYSMEVHGTKPEFNATATDNYDANVTVQVTDNINVDVVGTYKVTFTATDAHGNTEVVEKTFEVKDTTKPVITIDENNVYEMEVHGDIPEFNATAEDNYDAEVTVEITNNINKDVTGTYTVTFTSTDAHGNTEVVEKSFEVKDTTKPEITLDTVNVYEMEVHGDIPEFNATAEDNYDETVNVVITNNINKDVVGSYKVAFTATDAHNNTQVVEKTFTVKDTTKPVIAVDEHNTYSIEVHNAIPAFNATAEDNYDENVEVVITNNINKDVVGNYKVTFTATDANNNTQVVEKDFTVVDTTAPVIELTGAEEITLEVLRDAYNELGATATDNYDTEVTVITTGTVNTSVVDDYTITYTAQDTNGNVADTVTRLVHVVDTTKPTITLNGDAEITLEVLEDTYTEQGATAEDNYDETVAVVITGSVNKNVIGDYTIKYNAQDANGNAAEEVTRTVHVVDTTKPTIALDNSNVYSMEVFGQIPEFKATALDAYDGGITVVITNNINPTVVGTYKVTFTATDSHNNSKVVEKEFTVVDTTKPVITLNGAAEMTLEAKVNTYEEYGAVAQDNYDGYITSRIVREGTVNTDVIGDYTITYNVTDTNGNVANQVTRTVHVKDSLAPTITINDENYDYDILVDGEIPNYLALASASDIYDGETTVTVDTSDIDVTTVGIYTIEFKSIDTHNNIATAYRTVNVIRRDLTADDIILSVDNDTYDGTAKTVTAAVVDAKKNYVGAVTFEPQEVINAGDYIFTINVDQGTKYNAASFEKTITINKANVDIKDITFGFADKENATYRTEGYVATLGSYDTNVLGATIKYYDDQEQEVNEVKNIGTYKAVATFALVNTDNYDKILVNGVEGNTLEDTITINEATIDTSGIVFDDLTVDYTGNAVTMVATNIPEGVTVKYYVNGTEVENISVIEAGTYNVKVAIYSTDANYNVDPTEKNAVLKINKIAYPTELIDAITFNKTFLYDGTAHTVTATNVPEDVTFTTNPASFIDAGDYNDVVVNFVTTNNNYNNPASKTINVKVNPANPELVVTLSKTTLNVTNDSIQITATAQDFDTEEPITGLEYTYSVDSENGDEVSISDTGVITGNGHLGNVTIRVTTVATGNYAAASVTKNIEVVDTTAPVIELVGASYVEATLGDEYDDPGVIVTDNFYTDVQPIVNIYKVEDQSAPTTIDVTREGMYIIKYDAVDGSGNNATQVTRTVYVKDKEAPELTLKGNATQTIEVKSVESYEDPGVSISDNYYTEAYLQQYVTRTYNPTSGVNVNVVGTYTITYGLADGSGNVAESVTRTINVVDTTAPEITLVGNAEITLEAGETYTEQGATASDNYDEEVIVNISGTVDTSVVDDYTITYTAQDVNGNDATPVTRLVHVVDTTKPVITLVGNAEITLQVDINGYEYEDLGATASDTYDGDITSRIVPTGIDAVDTTTVGTYKVYYNVTDTHNNAADTVIRTVHVVDTTKPVITVDDNNNVYEMEVQGDIPTFAATATDNYDGTLIVPQPTHNIDKDVVGEYTIIFSVTDSNGNTQTATRSFTVKDGTPPTIESITMPTQIEVHSEFTADDITVVATDNYDLASELTITKNINNLNVHSLGEYDIIITVKDKSGNTKEKTRTIEVVDTTKPTAELIDGTLEDGVYHKTMEVLMDDATDADVIPVEILVKDNYDADRVVTFPFGVVRAKAAGYYTFTFTPKDSSDNLGDAIQLGITVKKRDLDDSIKEHETVSVGYDGQDHKVVKNIPEGAGEATYRLVKHIGDTDVEVTEAIDVGSYTEYLEVATNGKYVGFDEIEIATIEITENALSDEDMIVTASRTEFNNTDKGNGTITTVINNVSTSYDITYVSDNQNVVIIDDEGAFTVVGKGTAHINVTFSSLNYASKTKTITITVSDNSKPVISLEGETTQTIEIGNDYVEAGYSALDDSVNITSDVQVTWDTPYNKDVAGTYIVRYNVTDAAGNAADEVTRTITVEKTTTPTISYSGETELTIEAGDTYTELTQSDFTITDSYYTQDSDFTLSVEGTVDNRTVGQYVISYKAIDRSGKESNTITRTVHVVDTTKPVLVTNPGTLQLSTTKGDGNPERVLSLSEIEATDNSSATLTLTKIDSTVQLNLAGTYTQTYKLADAAGNYITFNISYRVYDRVSEVSYLENGQMVLLQNGDTFDHNIKLYFDGTATLDGEAISSGTLIGEGEHRIIVTNDDGISLTIDFTITIPRPEIIVKESPNGDPIELQPYNFYNEPIYLEFRNATKVIIVYYTTENVEQRVEITDPDLIAAGYVLTNANGTGNFTQYSINAIANDEENIIASIIVV